MKCLYKKYEKECKCKECTERRKNEKEFFEVWLDCYIKTLTLQIFLEEIESERKKEKKEI